MFGVLPEGWEETTLGDVCRRGGGKIQTGPFGSQLHASDYVPVGIPTVMPANIGDNYIVEDGIARVRESDAQRLDRHRLQMGDIVYSRRGDVERRALVRSREVGWLCGTGSLLVRVGENFADSVYISLWLGHPQVRAWITQHAVGATMANLNTEILSEVPVVVPPLSEQRAIAGVLGALDEKIESNRRQVQVLDELMVSIYQASLGGDLVHFLDIASPVSGGTPRRSEPEFWIPEIPWASAKDISAASAGVILSTFERISRSGLANSAAELVPAGTTVITARGTVGAIARLGVDGTFNQSCYGLIPSDPGVHYLEVYLATRASVDELKRSSHGTVFDTITRQTFELLRVQRLDERSRTETVMELESLDQLVIARLRESSKVMELRDTLLPELLSGRLRVRDAEKAVEGAL